MNGIKILKLSLAVVIAATLIYTIVYIFVYGDKQTIENYKKFGQSIAREKMLSTQGTDPNNLAIDGILINTDGGQYSYMKSDITIKMKNKADKKKLEKSIKKVRDLILKYSSTKSGDVLATPKGKEEYKNDLKKMIRKSFGYDVEAIYFRNFVLAQ